MANKIENFNKYDDGKIYKLFSSHCHSVFIGCTTYSLRDIFKYHLNLYEKKEYNSIQFKILQYDDCNIELIEHYPCHSKKDLLNRQIYWIKQYDTLALNIDKLKSLENQADKLKD